MVPTVVFITVTPTVVFITVPMLEARAELSTLATRC